MSEYLFVSAKIFSASSKAELRPRDSTKGKKRQLRSPPSEAVVLVGLTVRGRSKSTIIINNIARHAFKIHGPETFFLNVLCC